MSEGKTLFIPLSGFLGAGKTTLMLAAAELLRSKGLTVAAVTNDQGDLLVDSNMVEKRGLPFGQVQGGCFCCRFDDLAETLHMIMAANRPDVILAEAVGSCTDLTATVIRPLLSLYGDLFKVRQLTSVIDPLRLEQMISGGEEEKPSGFSPEIGYIFRKQLEEASCLLLNKTDLLSTDRIERLAKLLRMEFPEASVLTASTINGDGVNSWLEHIVNDAAPFNSALDIDYDIYAAGESQLGWLNAAFTAEGAVDDVAGMCQAFTSRLAGELEAAGAEIAHLKLWAQDETDSLKMSIVRNTGSCLMDDQPDTLWSTDRVTVWINARIQTDHNLLEDKVLLAVEWLRSEFGLDVTVHELECFAPARPVPTYRIPYGGIHEQ